MSGTLISLQQCLDLFNEGSIEAIRTSDGFQTFVEYVFTRAGYAVQQVNKPGDSIHLFRNSNLAGTPDAVVIAGAGLVGQAQSVVIALRGQIRRARNTGYLVSASGFTPEAVQEAGDGSKIKLVNVSMLKRYIEYIRGTRHENSRAIPLSIIHLFHADTIVRRPPTRTKVLAVANNKGGVAKTTTALNLAFALREKKQRVLLVDLDAQANITKTLPAPDGVRSQVLPLVEYFLPGGGDSLRLSQFIRPTHFEEICLIPSNGDLTLDDTTKADWPETELRFVRDLHDNSAKPVQFDGGEFDWIILDTPPAMSLHTRAALAASHYVLAPVTPGPFAESGLEQLFKTIAAMQGLMVQELKCLVVQ